MLLMGEWQFGDSLKDFVLELKKADGGEFDLTTATSVTLIGKCRQTGANLSKVGNYPTPVSGVVTFSDLTAGLPVAPRERDLYECKAKIVFPSTTGWSDPFLIAIVNWP